MQNTQPSKSHVRNSHSHTITGPIPEEELNRLERVYQDSPAIKFGNWNPKRNTADCINGQSLLNLQRLKSKKQRHKDNNLSQDRIAINVCGDRYETHRTTLELFPETLLGNNKRRKYYYDSVRDEYFFDRNRACFEAILYYYQSNGRLRRPDYVALDIFLEEVQFFQLGQEALNQIRKDENIKEVKKVRLPKNRFRRHLWVTMEYPDYSKKAKIMNIVSLIMILVSTIELAVESLPQYVDLDDTNCQNERNMSAINNGQINGTDVGSANDIYICHLYFTSPFFLIQAVCIGFFTIEFLLRIISTPSLLDFIKNLMNWIDLAAVIPFYIILGIESSGRQNQIDRNSYVGLRLLRVLRLARVFKFYRVFRNVKSLRVLATTIKQSLPDFFIMITLLTLLGFLFGAAAYFAENDSNTDEFDSIFKATYWGIITITSVGYGDISPITVVGRIIGCLCALFGAATIGMLVSVLVDRYQRVFARKLYIKEEEIDFNDISDDENNDTVSGGGSFYSGSHRNSKIEDPDARAKENAVFQIDDTTELPQTSEPALEIGNSRKQSNTRTHFIIGYVDDERQETSRDLLEKISAVVAEKQISGDNISLNIISNEQFQQQSPSFGVQFKLASSDDEDSDDVNVDLTEIKNDSQSKGNVLKTFQRPLSLADIQIHNPENNV